MAFPNSALPVGVRLALGADPTAAPSSWTWTDITSYVRVQDGSTAARITAGRSDESSTAAPSSCAFQVDNSDGRFTPTNAAGAWFGQIRRGTPVQVYVTPDDVADAFGRTVSGGWGTADSGQSWAISGAASDYSVSGGAGVQSLSAVSAAHISSINVGSVDQDFTVDGQFGVASATGAPITLWVTGRFTDVNNLYQALLTLDPSGQVKLQLLKRVGGTVTQLTGSVNITGANTAATWWRVRLQVAGSSISAMAWRTTDSVPTTWQVSATDTSLTTGTGIGLASRLEAGNTNTLPVAAKWDNLARPLMVRFAGFLADLPPRWDPSLTVAWVEITAAGILRRLSQGTPPRISTLRAAVDSDPIQPYVYWPMEGAAGAARVYDVIRSLPTESVNQASASAGQSGAGQFGVATLGPGSDLAPNIAGSWILTGSVRPVAPAGPFTVAWAMNMGTQVRSGTATILSVHQAINVAASHLLWQVQINDGGTVSVIVTEQDIHYVTSSGPTTVATPTVGFWFDGQPRTFMLQVSASGGSGAAWALLVNDVSVASGTYTATFASPMAAGVQTITVNCNAPADATVAFGHLALYTVASGFTGRYQPALGWAGETAGDRVTRVCGEQNITVTVQTGDTGGELLGPQPVDALLPVLRDVEDADMGLLAEYGHGLRYVTREARYNPPVTLALDITARDLAGVTPEPTQDDQQLRNDLTVTRPDGDSAQVTDPASITAVGRYADEKTVNVAGDDQLPHQAGWRVHLGTTDELRWPSLSLNLRARPGLIAAWGACDVGSRVTVAHPPSQATHDTLDLIVLGWTEVLSSVGWWVDLILAPARPWRVWTIEGTGNYGRVDTDGSTLNGTVTAAATSLSVATTDATTPVWTTDPADMPFDIGIEGERVTVNDVFGPPTNFLGVNNSGFDASIGTWTGAGNATVAQATTPTHSDGGSLAVTAVAAGTMSAAHCTAASILTSGMSCAAGDTVVCSAWLLAGSVARSVQVGAQFYDGAGAVLSLVNGTAVNDATSGWTKVTATVTAPASSARCRLVVTIASAGGAGEVHYIDDAGIGDATTGGSAQTFTATRAVNGVSKGHSSGAAVSLWNPPVIAL